MTTDRLLKPSMQASAQVLDDQERVVRRQTAAANDTGSAIKIAAFRTDLDSRAGHCPEHGDFIETGFRIGSARPRDIWQGCPSCADAKSAAEREVIAAKGRQQAMDRRLSDIDSAAIPQRFRSRDFASFMADTDAKEKALADARDYAEHFPARDERGQGLVFSGLPGTGKSHLAASIMLHVIDGNRQVQYVSCMGLIRAVRDTWRKGSEQSERSVIAHFGKAVDLLVIDEVGVQYGSDSEKTILFEILDRRYAEMRPTILLTNQDKNGFKGFVGDRVFDRLAETCKWVAFDWESYRPTARREAAAT
jgi:DNA replication protein DnaC